MPEGNESVSEELTRRRKKLGVSQRQLAERAGLRSEQVSRAEHHEVGDLTVSKIRAALEWFEHRYGADDPTQVVSVIELPDGRKVTFTGSPADVAAAVRDVLNAP